MTILDIFFFCFFFQGQCLFVILSVFLLVGSIRHYYRCFSIHVLKEPKMKYHNMLKYWDT